ncbi:MAG: choice-of-anchor Q domain-containing protein [Gemmataceae bacterium]
MFASSWLRQLQHRWFGRRVFHRIPIRGVRPRLERLEDRMLLSGSLPYAPVTNYTQLAADITAANLNGGANTITLGTTIQLTGVDNHTNGANGLPVIVAGDQLTIVGNSFSIERSTVASTPAFRLFDVASGASLTLQNVTLQGGLAQGAGIAAEGGAIYNSGTLTLSGVTVQSNIAAEGGAIYNSGTLTLSGVTVQSNKAEGANGIATIGGTGGTGGAASGGGVYAAGGVVTLSNDILSGNEALGGRGVNGTLGSFVPTGAGFSFHQGTPGGGGGAASGGGLFVAGGNIILSNDTLSGNEVVGGAGGTGGKATIGGTGGTGGAASGGGVYVVGGAVMLTNDTLSSNTAAGGTGGRGGEGDQNSTSGPAVSRGGNGGVGGTASGGGLYVAGGTVTLTKDNLGSNKAAGGTGGGGGRINLPVGDDGGSGGAGGAASGGGVDAAGPAVTVVLSNATLSGDEAVGGVGGFGVSESSRRYNSADNHGGSGTGGGLYLDAGSVTLSNATLSGNEAVGGHGGGTRLQVPLPGIGGTASGGGLYVAGGNVKLTNVTLNDNKDVAGNGGFKTLNLGNGSNGVNNAYGGGLYVAGGTVTLNKATLSSNQVVAGVGSGSTLAGHTFDLPVAGNGGNAYGGGLYVTGGTVTLSSDTLSGNQALGGNGVHGPTYSGYYAGSGGSGGAASGGGLYVAGGDVTLTNDTLSGNDAVAGNGGNGGAGEIGGGSGFGGSGGAASGGGVDVTAGTVTLLNVTLSGNAAVAGNGGNGGYGIYIGGKYGGNGGNGGNGNGGGLVVASGGTANLANTLIALNTTTAGTAGAAGSDSMSKSGTAGSTSAPDVSGTVASSDHDLIGNSSGSSGFSTAKGDILNPVSVGLGSLANNGGATQTMALLPGSPAIDAGDSTAPNLPATDQRGYARTVGNSIDIGAYQTQGFNLTVASGNNQSTLVDTAFANPLVVTVSAKDGIDPVAGGQLTFMSPTSGASAALTPGNTVTIAADGMATVNATANGTVGSYQITAYTAGVSAPAAFALTNEGTVITPNNATITFGATSVALKATITSGGVGVAEGTVTFTVLQNGNLIGKATATSSFDSNGNVSVSYALPAGLNAGSYTIEADYSDNSLNFAAASGQASLTITPAPLTITVNDATMIQGEVLPTFAVSYSGFVLGEGPGVLGGTLTFSTTATSSSPPGIYAITASGLTSTNYDIRFVPGTLTILSYSQATTYLQAQVDTASLDQGTQSSLDTQLQEAAALFQANNTTAGINVLEAFIHYVSAQSGKHINATLADAWIAYAQRILNAIG